MAEQKAKQYISDNAQLMAEWDWEKNGELSPSEITTGSNKKVWWHCINNHQWEMRPSQRNRGQGCPYCSNRQVWAGYNDLASTHPAIASQWDTDKNTFLPQEVTFGSNKKVYWKCSLGHSYLMSIHKKIGRNAGCPICSGHKTVTGINDFATNFPNLASEWHPTKNGDLDPGSLSKKNGKKVWWMCQYGHEWQATLKDRANDNTGCPICKARLSTSFPEQAIYYYIKKLYPDAENRYKDVFDNKMELDIYIPSIHLGIEFDGAAWHNSEEAHHREREKYILCQQNNIKLIRIKEHTNNEWKDVADVNYIIQKRRNRTELSKIIQTLLNSIDPISNMWTRKNPLCFQSNIDVDLDRDENDIREFLTIIPNSLIKLKPDIANEWHPTKNGNLTPNMFGINSNDYAWWQCKTCGHEWRTTIIHRAGIQNSGCPECSKKQRGKTFTKTKITERGSLAENNPQLAKEWHPSKNGTLTPSDITSKSPKKIWWFCKTCGHEWEATPNNRSKGSGCPCCSGRVPKIGINDFQTLFPSIAAEWSFEKNSPYVPEQFLPKSNKSVWWKCKECNHEWKATIMYRTNGHGCPECAKQKRKQSK